MTPGELLDLFRGQSGDTADPPLWSDSEVYRYMDRAQTLFARRTDGIRDSISAITQVIVTPTDTFIPISPKILRVFDARDNALGRRFKVLNSSDPCVSSRSCAGSLHYLVVGESENMLRAVDRPTVATPLTLFVGRLPLTSIIDSNSTFEIRDEYTDDLLDGLFEQAYLKDDEDTYNRLRSESAGAAFTSKCLAAKVELERRNYVPGLVHYGGL